MKLKIFLFLLIIFLNFNTGFALAASSKSLYFEKNCSYLLSFDEKILRYSLENTNTAKIEVLSNIFNDRHELLIKPVENVSTNLTVWTQDNAYSFNISIIKPSSSITQNENTNLALEEKYVISEFELDKPPYISKDQDNVFSFELDKPPRAI